MYDNDKIIAIRRFKADITMEEIHELSKWKTYTPTKTFLETEKCEESFYIIPTYIIKTGAIQAKRMITEINGKER